MELTDPILDELKRQAPQLCVCLIGYGDDMQIVGVTDYATANTWRLQDTAHWAFEFFVFGKIDERETAPYVWVAPEEEEQEA